MGSMNNWLGFSLSPQENHHTPQDHHSQTSSDHQCFDLTSDSSVLPSLNLPPPFGILEAFNRNNNNHSHSQDWNMKDMGNMTSDNTYKSTSDFSMLMGGTSTSCTNNHTLDQNQAPKLENFLGGNTFAHHGHYMYPPEAAETATSNGGATTNIGLSMIKNWLRNQPTPPPPENKNDGRGVVEGSNGNLSLSMSTDSQTGSPLPLMAASGGGGGGGGGGESTTSLDGKQKGTSLDAQTGALDVVPRKSIDTFGQRTSIYRGVTRHRWTGRYEAHLWDNSCRREGQTRKGRQVYLGGYDKEEKAARAYDLAALKYWGTTTTTNFPISNYEKEVEEMKHMTRQEYVASLRRKSSGFSRGASIYRGVTRHHQHGRWQARIGRVAGNKDLYLGTFSTQEEAAEAYDIAAIKFRGLNAVTNFDMSRYDVKSILESSTLPIGGAAKRLKDAELAEMTMETQRTTDENLTSTHLAAGISNYGSAHNWPTIAYQPAQPFSMHYPYGQQQRVWCKQEQDDIDIPTHTFQDLNQLQLGNTHNFFQPNNVLHNLMSLDSASLDHSSGSNSAVYSNGGGDGGGGGGGGGSGYGGGNSGFVMPIATSNTTQNGCFGDNEIKGFGYESMFGSNLYYNLPHQSPGVGGAVKAANVYDHGSTCNNWVPTAVPTLTPRANNMAVCHGAQTFTVWNDT